jgi:hypothetical protein
MASFSKSFYYKHNSPIKGDIVLKLLKFLIKEQYFIHYKGYKKASYTRMSRLKPTTRWDTLIQEKKSILNIKNSKELIILKDSNKKTIPFVKTQTIANYEKILNNINELYKYTIISSGKKILSPQKLYRVFNNSSFKQGGRYYGGDWQTYSKRERPKIMINGQVSTELDFNCLHITLLYFKKGKNYNEDAYSIKDYKGTTNRNLIKLAVVIALNSSSKQAAIKAIRYKITKEKLKVDPTDLLEKILKKHALIQEYFFKQEIGSHLQFQESRIATIILEKSLKYQKKLIILPIHDGFICQKIYEKRLKQLMIKAYKLVNKGGKIKISKIY